MSYSKQLREKLARLSVELRAIVSTAKADGNRGLNGDEQTKFNTLEAEYTQTENSIKAAERSEQIDADLATVPGDAIVPVINPEAAVSADGGRGKKRSARDEAFSAYLRHGAQGLDAEQRAALGAFRGVQPGSIRAAQTLTTGGGGYLIPQGFSDQLEEAMKWYGGILGNVGEFSTETGNPLPWPTVNDTANMGQIIGVNTQVSEQDFAFSQVTFNAYIFSSNSVLIPLALIEDSYFDLDAFTARNLGIRLGRIVNHSMTVGTGGGTQPTGLVPAVVAAGNTIVGAVGETTSVSYTDLVDLLHAVDPAYRSNPSSKFMFHDSTLKALRLLKDTAGRPLWQPGLTAGFGQGFPETILDRPYVINNDMAVMAADANSILYGDLSKYKVRRVATGTTVMRLVERYADYLQVGYIAFLRADGNLVDAGTHPIAVFSNSAT